jgi:hypothetical protein
LYFWVFLFTFVWICWSCILIYQAANCHLWQLSAFQSKGFVEYCSSKYVFFKYVVVWKTVRDQ